MSDLTSSSYVQQKSNKLTSTQQAAEYWNCRRNPFYFIFNYVYIPEIGGILKYDEPMMHYKMRQTIKSVYNYHKVILMATRQLGKALDLETLIPCPTLDNSFIFRKLKDVHVNDYVLNEHGQPIRVIAETEIQYNRPCFKLYFSNNVEVIADAEHEWKVVCQKLKQDDYLILTTQELYNILKGKYDNIIIDIYQKIDIINIETVESVPVKCIQVDNPNGMFLITNNYIPTHNSTIAASYMEWAANFYPNMPITILNMDKKSSLENIEKIKFIHNALPDFLRTPLKYKGDRKTTLDYSNHSIIRVFYPSSATSPSTLARSFTSPGLYIDEAAHIRHIQEAYTSAQPTLFRAKEQAIKHKFPHFIILTSTPNGSVGDGEWFYQMYSNAVDATEIFDDDCNLVENADEIVDNPTTNGFVKVRFHWSDDPAKDENWYAEQCRDLNFDTRSINQELDLVFVGSTSCIFSDDFLSKLKIKEPIDRIQLPHVTDLKLFIKKEEINKNDFLLIGIDTAKSLTGDYSAIEIFKYSNFEQIGEFYAKLGSLTKYSEIIMKVIDTLDIIMSGRLILCIENNSIGTSIIEDLENAEDNKYAHYIYSPNPKKYIGINTNSKVKPTMISFLYDIITQDPSLLKSEALINQLNLIERRVNGTIAAKSGTHDDLFMASALCAYVKKISSLEYEPLLGVSIHIQNQQNIQKIKQATSFNQVISSSNNSGISISYNKEEGGIEYNINPIETIDDEESLVSIF